MAQWVDSRERSTGELAKPAESHLPARSIDVLSEMADPVRSIGPRRAIGTLSCEAIEEGSCRWISSSSYRRPRVDWAPRSRESFSLVSASLAPQTYSRGRQNVCTEPPPPTSATRQRTSCAAPEPRDPLSGAIGALEELPESCSRRPGSKIGLGANVPMKRDVCSPALESSC